MSIIISIKQKYADKILSGEKKIEIRKRIWTKIKKIKKAYIYVPRPVSLITGFFLIDDIFKSEIKTLWILCKDLAGMTKEEYDIYFNNHFHGYGIYTKDPKRFKKPIDPYKIDSHFRAPQNFMYVKKELEKKLERGEVI